MKIQRYYICDKCKYAFDMKQDRDAPLKKKCPYCGTRNLYQDLTGQYVRVIGTATTVLQQAERNDKKLGKELLDIKRKEQKERKKNGKNQILEEAGIKHHKPQAKEPWFGKLPDEVDKKIKTNPEKTEKYIITGEV